MITRQTARHAHGAVVTAFALVMALGSLAAAQSPSISPQPTGRAAPSAPATCPPTLSTGPAASAGASTGPCATTPASFTWEQAAVPGIDTGGITVNYLAINSAGDMSMLGNAFPDQRKSKAWHSTDGLTWTPAKLDWRAAKDAGGATGGIAIVGDQFLAIGNNSGGWTALSKTGETWKVDKQGIDGGKRFALPYAITTTPDGAAAGGTSGRTQTATHTLPAVWTTTDGTSWKRTELPPSGQAFITAIAATSSGMLAAGAQGVFGADGLVRTEAPALWVAPDGVTWQSVPMPFVGDGALLRSLTATASGLLLVLNDYRDKNAYAGTIWSSTDGLAWHQVFSTEPFLLMASYGPLGVFMSTPTKLLRSMDDGATWSETPLPAAVAGSFNTLLAQTPDGRLIAGFYAGDNSGSSLWVGTPTP